jgi:predicted ribosome quality control (RQC) complex YloA/Tae2 family protein
MAVLSYAEMIALSCEVKNELVGGHFLNCVEIGDKKWLISFDIGRTKRELLISAHYPYNRFHLSQEPFIGKETPLTRTVTEYLHQATLIDIQLLGNDWILDLKFNKRGQELHFVIELCIRHPKIMILNAEWKILASREKIPHSIYRLPERKIAHEVVEVMASSQEVEQRYDHLEKKENFEKRRDTVRAFLKTRLKKAEERLSQHQMDIVTGEKWQEEEHFAELLKNHFSHLKRGMSEIELEDWEKNGATVKIPLDPALDPQEQLKRKFKLSRKLKKRKELATGWIPGAEKEVALFSAYLTELEHIQDEEALTALEKKAGIKQQPSPLIKKKVEKGHPFREFTTQAGCKIFIGKNDRDNDRLTFTFAHGLDLWMHASHTPGSHVVLRAPKEKKIDEDSHLDALHLAIYFSKARGSQEAEVTVAECKHVSKTKGAKPGQVNVSKPKTIRVRIDPARLGRLLGKLGF